MKRPIAALAGLTFLAGVALADSAGAQRTATPTDRTSTLTKADLFYSDLTCEVKAFQGWAKMVSADVEIPNGGSATQKASPVPVPIYFKAYLKNRGTKRAAFNTTIGVWKPPALWKFFDMSKWQDLESEAQTVAMTLESSDVKVIGPFWLKPVEGSHNFNVQVATDVGNGVAEPDEKNNACRISITVDGGSP